MFGYSKEKFSCIIDSINPINDIAQVSLRDKNGKQSFMEIHSDDLKTSGIECEAGVLFSLILHQFFEWEKITFRPVKKVKITKEEIEAKRKYYEERYDDI